MFALFDDDQSGKITLRNLKRVAKELGEQISGTFGASRLCVLWLCVYGCWVVWIYMVYGTKHGSPPGPALHSQFDPNRQQPHHRSINPTTHANHPTQTRSCRR